MKELAVILVLSVLYTLAGPLRRPLGRAFGALFAPPHGRWVLAATWLLAAVTVVGAIRLSGLPDSTRALIIICAPTLAIVSLVVARDRAREAAHLPAVTHQFSGQLSMVTRVLLFLIGVLSFGLGVASAVVTDRSTWTGALSMLAFGAALIYVAVRGNTGRFVAGELGSAIKPPSGPSEPAG